MPCGAWMSSKLLLGIAMGSGRKTNRRQFLKGKAALDALQHAQFGATVPEVGSDGHDYRRPQSRQEHLLQLSRRAMACDFQIYCNPFTDTGAVDAANAALNLIDALEDQLTVYRDHSEIMELNRRAAAEPCVVEARLFRLLQRCVELSRATGAPSISPLVRW